MKFRFWIEGGKWKEDSDDEGTWGTALSTEMARIILGYLAMRLRGLEWTYSTPARCAVLDGATWEEVLK